MFSEMAASLNESTKVQNSRRKLLDAESLCNAQCSSIYMLRACE